MRRTIPSGFIDELQEALPGRVSVNPTELARHGRAGVPLYLVYDRAGAEPVILPQILTEGLVVRALEAAAG